MTPTKMTANEEYATKAVVVQRVQYVHVEADKGIGTDRETAGVHIRAVARPVASFIGDTDVEWRRHECVNPGIPQVLAHIKELRHCEESICRKRQVRAMLFNRADREKRNISLRCCGLEFRERQIEHGRIACSVMKVTRPFNIADRCVHCRLSLCLQQSG